MRDLDVREERVYWRQGPSRSVRLKSFMGTDQVVSNDSRRQYKDAHSIAAYAIFSAASRYPLRQYSPASLVQTQILHCPSFSKSRTSSGLGSRLSKSMVMTSWPPSSISTDRPAETASVSSISVTKTYRLGVTSPLR